MTERTENINQLTRVEGSNFFRAFAANLEYNPNRSLFTVNPADGNRSSKLKTGCFDMYKLSRDSLCGNLRTGDGQIKYIFCQVLFLDNRKNVLNIGYDESSL